MGLTYVQLKQAILDWTENDATEFTTATGSGIAPVDLCIQLAEQRLVREADITAYRKTYDITLSANNGFFDMPQDLFVTRYIKIKTGEFLMEKDLSDQYWCQLRLCLADLLIDSVCGHPIPILGHHTKAHHKAKAHKPQQPDYL